MHPSVNPKDPTLARTAVDVTIAVVVDQSNFIVPMCRDCLSSPRGRNASTHDDQRRLSSAMHQRSPKMFSMFLKTVCDNGCAHSHSLSFRSCCSAWYDCYKRSTWNARVLQYCNTYIDIQSGSKMQDARYKIQLIIDYHYRYWIPGII